VLALLYSMIAFTVQKRITVDEALAHPYLEPVADLLQDNTKEMARGLVMNIVPKKRDNKQKKELCQKVLPLPLLPLSVSLPLMSLRSWRRWSSTLTSTALPAASNRPPPEATPSWRRWGQRRRRTIARSSSCSDSVRGRGMGWVEERGRREAE
jgi:hypothetical protein